MEAGNHADIISCKPGKNIWKWRREGRGLRNVSFSVSKGSVPNFVFFSFSIVNKVDIIASENVRLIA